MNLVAAYETLGLPIGAENHVVRAAYRRLVAYYHPDRNAAPEALARTQQLNQAFTLLERAGFPSEDGVRGRTSQAYAYGAHDEDDGASWGGRNDPFSHYYRDFREPPRTTGRPGRTLSRKVKLTLEEAALGKIIEISGNVTDNCTTCHGGRWTSITTCTRCRGSGRTSQRRQRTVRSWYSEEIWCTECHGTGEIRVACGSCAGTGHGSRRTYTHRVRVPAGVVDGDRVVIRFAGGRSEEGDGDIKIRVEVQPHDLFSFDADGYLCVSVPVHPLQVLGRQPVRVPTLWGERHVFVEDPDQPQEIAGAGFIGRHGERFPLRVRWVMVFVMDAHHQVLASNLWDEIRREVDDVGQFAVFAKMANAQLRRTAAARQDAEKP